MHFSYFNVKYLRPFFHTFLCSFIGLFHSMLIFSNLYIHWIIFLMLWAAYLPVLCCDLSENSLFRMFDCLPPGPRHHLDRSSLKLVEILYLQYPLTRYKFPWRRDARNLRWNPAPKSVRSSSSGMPQYHNVITKLTISKINFDVSTLKSIYLKLMQDSTFPT